ncbi:hypothetical protein ACOIY8_003291, partial [Listeria monocytogenes]
RIFGLSETDVTVIEKEQAETRS